jgi:imidazolonepropionase-like amidohydrolase
MTIGTDMNNPFVAPGISVAREAGLHVEAGIPAWDVLRMATTNAAALLKVSDRTGRLRSGMEADILFLDADPSIDIAALTKVRAVVENGRLHEPEALMAEARL